MYSELQTLTTAFLASEIPGPSVLAEAPPNTPETVKAALNSKGLVLLIGKPRQKPIGGRAVEVSLPLQVLENEEINFSAGGANMTPDALVTSATFALDQYVPDTFWAPMNAMPFDQLPPEEGLVGWGVLAKTQTIIARSFAVLADHNGFLIVNEAAKAFQSTNRKV